MDMNSNTFQDSNLERTADELEIDETTLKCPSKVETVMEICLEIEKRHLTPKSFVNSFLQSKNRDVVVRRRLWVSERDWNSTARTLEQVRDLPNASANGQIRWQSWVLEQAKIIVNEGQRTRGQGKEDLFINSAKVSRSMFEKPVNEPDNREIQTHMPFMYEVILTKLEHAAKLRKHCRDLKEKRVGHRKNIETEGSEVSTNRKRMLNDSTTKENIP